MISASNPPVTDCSELQRLGINTRGFYYIDPTGQRQNQGLALVYCQDGWTYVLKREKDPNLVQDPWTFDFLHGIGAPGDKEFFTGLLFLHQLTNLKQYNLRVRLWSDDNNNEYGEATYDRFEVGDERSKWALLVNGFSSANDWRILDSFYGTNGSEFTMGGPCRGKFESSNWFSNQIPECSYANFFGPHSPKTSEAGSGLFYMGLNGLGGTLSKAMFAIRPHDYESLISQPLSDQDAMLQEWNARQTSEYKTVFE